ncbi:glyoxalase-like domain protein [Leptolyngbya sp. FACHB-261]|nr:glyoxalase-like domain protein [Leptolyngbya sp. FACHB-261]
MDGMPLLTAYSWPSLSVLLPLDALFSTQSVMVMLLGAYAVAMWMFLTSAPKVHTVMVSDLDQARSFYEGQLDLPAADVPLHYYYNYEQTLGAGAVDPLYFPADMRGSVATARRTDAPDGLWYQLEKNVQLHVISGANSQSPKRDRHVCFDRDCLEKVLMRAQTRGVKYKIRAEKPLNFLVKDRQGRVIEMSEATT